MSVTTIENLPTELWQAIGSKLPDKKSLVAFTATCRCAHSHRFRLLTDNQRILCSLLERVVRHTHVLLEPFVNACKASPHRNAQMLIGHFDALNPNLEAKIVELFPNTRFAPIYFKSTPVVMVGGGEPPWPREPLPPNLFEVRTNLVSKDLLKLYTPPLDLGSVKLNFKECRKTLDLITKRKNQLTWNAIDSKMTDLESLKQLLIKPIEPEPKSLLIKTIETISYLFRHIFG